MGSHQTTHRPGGRQAQVSVDVDLAHTMLDTFDDFLDRHAVGFLYVTPILIDDRQPLLWNRRRTVHHQVGVGDALVDFLDTVDRQHVTGRRLGEFVGAVTGADGDGQRINLGLLDEVGSFFRVRQHLAVVQHAFGADTVFFTGHAGFQRAQTAQFALYRHTTGVSHGHGLLGDTDVVLVVGWGLAIFAERAVHHDRAEAQLDGALADVRASAVVLVHAHRNVRELFDSRQDQVPQERRASVFAGAGGSLDDHRRVSLVSGFHDGAHLLKVVDVEGWNAVAVLGCVVQHLAHADKCHCVCLSRTRVVNRASLPERRLLFKLLPIRGLTGSTDQIVGGDPVDQALIIFFMKCQHVVAIQHAAVDRADLGFQTVHLLGTAEAHVDRLARAVGVTPEHLRLTVADPAGPVIRRRCRGGQVEAGATAKQCQ